MSAFQEYFDPSHQLVRDSVRRFIEREVLPHIADWEEAEEFPRELYRKAGAAGILGIGYPEQFGGSHEGDLFAKVAASEELMRSGSGGLTAARPIPITPASSGADTPRSYCIVFL